jgi:16S rRNA (adenine1518-N6/adenine1519-N6)-dimethyltransferase
MVASGPFTESLTGEANFGGRTYILFNLKRHQQNLMNSPQRQTRTHLIALFQEQGLHPRGDLGQNFLIDLNLLELIVQEARLGPDDVVLEVGAGTGGLTTYLSAAAAVVSVEFDSNMYALACQAVAGRDNVTMLHCDALKSKNQLAPVVMDALRRELAVDPKRRLKLVANLPYNIGTPVIANLIASDLPWELMVVTIQWELAERMLAKPRTGDYSALTVFLQAHCHLKMIRKLGPSVFWPKPTIDSAIVRIDPKPELSSRIVNRGEFQTFLRDIFTQRRKLLRGVVTNLFKPRLSKPQVDAVLESMKFPADTRAEELDVGQLIELSNRLQRCVSDETLSVENV